MLLYVCACVGACGCALEPHISAFCSACCCCWGQPRHYSLCVYGLLVRTFGHDICVCGLCVRRVRTSTVHTAIAQHVCVDRFCACVMLREHVTCATTTYCCRSIKLFKVNDNELFESAKLYLQIRLSSDVVRRPSRVVVRRASSFVARASFTLLPRLVTVLRKKEPI